VTGAQAVVERRAEWNHSCTSQCSNPCTVNRAGQPETGGRISEKGKIMGGWFMHGGVGEDAGDVGGDDQIGKAPDIRFAHFDMPGRLVTVCVYPSARELSLDEMPVCTHPPVLLESLGDNVGRFAPSPPEHLACSYDMDSVGLRMQTEFMICSDIEDPGGTEEWCDYRYCELDTRPYTGTVQEILAAAGADALKEVRLFNADQDIAWDGQPF